MGVAALAAAFAIAVSPVSFVQSHASNGAFAESGGTVDPSLTSWAVLGLHAAGAEMAFTFQGAAFGKRVLPMVEKLGSRIVEEADVENEPAPGETLLQAITYLKLTPTGLTYGYMNGMRPRGMVLFEGELKDGTLAGTMRFGGIDFRFSDGTRPPEIRFAFTKVK